MKPFFRLLILSLILFSAGCSSLKVSYKEVVSFKENTTFILICGEDQSKTKTILTEKLKIKGYNIIEEEEYRSLLKNKMLPTGDLFYLIELNYQCLPVMFGYGYKYFYAKIIDSNNNIVLTANLSGEKSVDSVLDKFLDIIHE
jgi:hypothetical protein